MPRDIGSRPPAGRTLRVFSFKFMAFALGPTVAILVAGEAAVRVKFFIAHGHNWYYLTTPFIKGALAEREQWLPPQPERAASAVNQAGGAVNQIEFKWPKPCADRMVYSTELRKEMPRTWDENCFRGDHVTQEKPVDEYRVVFLGGSTVEDAQSDAEMMAAQFKHAMPPTQDGKSMTVINAGKAGFESRRILLYWRSWVGRFTPDFVLYYEAFNEQPTDLKFIRVDNRLEVFRSDLHRALYYKSMLYTYLVEKFAFLTASDERFWKIDVTTLRSNFLALVHDVRDAHAGFTFVTPIARFPRVWKGVDTFDYQSVDALLDRLRVDRTYVYDASEISALNQHLAVLYTIALCDEEKVPVINILDDVEALGEARRAELFIDLAHLSVKGDKMVGELIASRVHLSR